MSHAAARIGVLALALCLAPAAPAQPSAAEQKAHAEQQRQKREAAQRKSQEIQQRQVESKEPARKQEELRKEDKRSSGAEQERVNQQQRERQERIDAQRQQEWGRASDAIKQDRSGSNIGRPQSLTAPVAPPAPPARTGPYSIPGSQGTAQPQYTTPAGKEPTTHSTATSASCFARPICTLRGEARNLCRSVQQTYNGTGAVQIGMQDIVQKCRSLNLPDPCGLAEGCAAQCPQVAHCTETSRR